MYLNKLITLWLHSCRGSTVRQLMAYQIARSRSGASTPLTGGSKFSLRLQITCSPLFPGPYLRGAGFAGLDRQNFKVYVIFLRTTVQNVFLLASLAD